MRLQIDDREVNVDAGLTILEAARQSDIYIPHLCSHPDLPSAGDTLLHDVVFQGDTAFSVDGSKPTHQGCGLCVVEVERRGEQVPACGTLAEEGMRVRTTGEELTGLRRQRLGRILTDHPHACLTCAQQEGCSRTQCSANVPVNERCCSLLGHCELQKLAAVIGLPQDLPRYRPSGRPIVDHEPLFFRDYNLCIACARCVRMCNNLRGVGALGLVWTDGRPVVGMIASSAIASGCRFCGACVEVCPTGALMDQDNRSKLHDQAKLVPCRSACPAGIDIPRYVRYVAAGRYDDAVAVVREKAPFPEVLGHVCFHPCEQVCRRGEINAPVSICGLKRIAAEKSTGEWKSRLRPPTPTGKRVAVVGAGPAGLTAAYFLARKGHAVAVFEALPEPGGMLRYGILSYRLPLEVVKKEIDEIIAVGVELRTNSRVTLQELQSAGFNAVLLATGAHGGRRLPVEGAGLGGIVQGVHLLRDIAAGATTVAEFASRRAVVVGGGNVAVDAARAVRRLGTAAVDLVCLEQRDEMPAFESEVRSAIDEGIILHNGWGPKRFLGNGTVSTVELRRCTKVFDSDGRFNPVYDDADTITLDAAIVVLAIGQSCELDYLGRSEVRITPAGTLQADESMQTRVAGVFAAGDVLRGPASVIEAIADGRRAAESIDRCLGGDGRIEEQLIAAEAPNPYLGLGDGFASRLRVEMPALPAESRASGFCLVELGYNPEQAAAEAGRCLQCDLRILLRKPEFPPDLWLPFDAAEIEKVPSDLEGVYVLADADKQIIKIKGTATLQADLRTDSQGNAQARFFRFEEHRLYSKRESELLQQYMQEHGRMPAGAADEVDDLF